MSNEIIRLSTNRKVVRFIMAAARNINDDVQHRKDPVLNLLFDRIVALSKVAPEIRGRHVDAHGFRRKLSSKTSNRLKELRELVSHFRTVLALRNRRTGREEWANDFFRLSHEGTRDQSADGVVNEAMDLIRGEATAVRAGLAPMANPSAEDLQVAIDNFLSQRTRAQNLEDDYRKAANDMAQLFEETQGLHRMIASAMRIYHSRDSDSACRTAMRKYGFVFVCDRTAGNTATSSEGEPPEGPVPTPDDGGGEPNPPDGEPDPPDDGGNPDGEGEEPTPDGEGDGEPDGEPEPEPDVPQTGNAGGTGTTTPGNGIVAPPGAGSLRLDPELLREKERLRLANGTGAGVPAFNPAKEASG